MAGKKSLHHAAHGHTHGLTDHQILATDRGIWAVKWSMLILMATATFQVAIVLLSGSVALLADTIHNFGDAATTIPLWIAFALARRRPSPRFTYGFGRVEDLAGVLIVAVLLFSAGVAAVESARRFFHPQPVEQLWTVGLAALIGYAGNELVARLRIKVGQEIHSAALVADGQHARVDGLTSLAVLLSVMGLWLGFPLADPLVGLAITAAILGIVWSSGKIVLERLLDGVDPQVVAEIRRTVQSTPRVEEVTDVRVRWLGHRLHAEINLAVAPELSVQAAHQIALTAREALMHQLPYVSQVVIHVDPQNASGEIFHHQ